MRILLLEDEEAIRGFVRINLKRNGMEVTEAEDGETALALAEAADPPFDAALLDVMLPTISGFEVCERLRRLFPRMGIIMLTAKSQEEDKIRGLELGADDYVQKPFSPGELIARLGALHRRMMPGGLSWSDQPAQPGQASGASARGESAAAGETAIRPANQAAAAHDPIGQGIRETSGSPAYGEGELPAERQRPDGSGAEQDTAMRNANRDMSHQPSTDAPSDVSQQDAAKQGMQDRGEPYAASGRSEVPPLSDVPSDPPSTPPTAGGVQSLAFLGGRPDGRGELTAGPFRLSAAQRRLWKNGEEVVLTPTEWTLVKLLMEREGEGLSRDDILSAVWGRHFIGDLKIVDVNIRRIRQKIEDNPSHPLYIETLWGFGYRFNRGGA